MITKWGKYIFVLVLTAGVFAISWYVSTSFSRQKLADIRNTQNTVATDILAGETDYSLSQELSCSDIDRAITSEELGALADKISYAEQNVNAADEIETLKKQYSILEVKDFLLKKHISERCKSDFASIFYFYGSSANCPDCVRQGYVLDTLRQKYPELRIYSFDYNLDLSTIRALRSIYKIDTPLPALVIDGTTYNGFKSVEDVEKLLPKDLTAPPKTAAPTVKK